MTDTVRAQTGRHRLTSDAKRYYREWCTVALLALAALVLLTVLQWGQSLGFLIYDQFLRWWPAQPGNQIVVIEIDDRTLELPDGWPLQRTRYAELLRQLADTGNHPKAIGFDILFADAMPEDPALAAQMRRHRVFLATELPRSSSPAALTPYPVSPVLAEAAQGLAHVNLSFEKDGSIRGAHLVQGGLPQLAVAMAGLRASPTEQDSSYRRFHLVDPRQGWPSASMADVLSGQMPLEWFKDKYVLIGATAPSLGDHFPTLHSGVHSSGTPGVMLHASLLGNLLDDQLITPVPLWLQLLLSSLVLLSAMVAVLVLSPLAELSVNALIALATLSLSWAVLITTHRWFDPGLCVMAVALFKPAWVWRRNEMIVSYLDERAAVLQQRPRRRKTLGAGLRLRHFTSDTLLQYSRLLDRAIDMVSNRLAFLQRLVEQIPVAMLVTDDQGRILLSNAGMGQVVPGSLLGEGGRLHAVLEHLGLSHIPWQELATRDQMVDLDSPSAGAQQFILRIACVEEGGGSRLWILSLADVTPLRQFQAQREQTLQLLSHDMRTPIASIIAINRSAASGTMAEDIHRHARTLLDMMDDFIFAIQAQAPRYNQVEALMDSLVDEAVHQVKDLAQARHMTLRLVQDEDPLFVSVDQRLFVRALVNVLVNAIRHGEPSGAIELSISRGQARLAPHWVCCRVCNLASTSVQSHWSETGKSFGLGLDFVKTVLHRHGGEVRVQLPERTGGMVSVELLLPLLP